MNKIMKKLQIPGYQTKVIIVPRKNKSTQVTDGVQLSLDFNSYGKLAPKN